MSVCRTALIVVLVSVVWIYIPQLLFPKLQPVWGGFIHKDFRNVEKIFRKTIEDGRLKGGAIAVYYKGELIVDLWGGYADDEAERPWNKDTMTVFYSTTKLVASVVIAHMVDKGLLDYKKPVSHYWPEFGQNGKDKITVEMLLSHQAGLAVLDEGVSIMDLVDNPKVVEAKLAQQKPAYEPGSRFGYHSLTFGLYVDSLVKKVDPKHRNISQIFQEDIADPFGIDYFIGVPKQHHHRMARIYPLSTVQAIWQTLTSGDMDNIRFLYQLLPISGSDLPKSAVAVKDMQNYNFVNDPDKAAIGVSSFNGQGSARGVAKLCSILANGGSYKGKQLLSPKTITTLSARVVEGTDQTINAHLKIGLGPMLNENSKGQTVFGHVGFGGQLGFVDQTNKLGFAYCNNHHSVYQLWNDPVMLELQKAVYTSII